MRIVVTGGRDYADTKRARLAIIEIDFEFDADEDLTLICGMAKGADFLAFNEAKARGWNIEEFPANWDKHGKAAGAIRNQQMIDAKPDLCIAFPGGRGTADMIDRCRKAGIPIRFHD